ncbi:MAG: hypothetical protein J6Q30_01625 [Oscillospiraceae bacterium]|nr:hypothetical protein [Oscillospiraceae bacterium]
MSYQIVYDSKDIKMTKKREKRKQKPLSLAILVILLIGVLRTSSWDDALWKYMIPGDANVTKSAFQNLTERLQNGDPLSDAIYVFCDTVIQGAALE